MIVGTANPATEILCKQFAALGTKVTTPSWEEFAAGPAMQRGDVVVIEAGQTCDIAKNVVRHVGDSSLVAPVIVLRSDVAPKLEIAEPFVTVLSGQVSRKTLIGVIVALDMPRDVPKPDVPDTDVLDMPKDGQIAAVGAQDTGAPKETESAVATRQMRILAAEDNKTNRLVFSKLVRNLNIELEFAENGVEAVQKWESFQPDLVFMDISMPQMDGKEATRRIREIEAQGPKRHTPIVALTAHAMSGDDVEILAAGLDHYLTKPLRKAAIFERIADAAPQDVLPVFEDDAPAVAAPGKPQTA